MKRRRRRYT